MEMTRAQGNGELPSSAESVCMDDEKAWRADGGDDSKNNVNGAGKACYATAAALAAEKAPLKLGLRPARTRRHTRRGRGARRPGVAGGRAGGAARWEEGGGTGARPARPRRRGLCRDDGAAPVDGGAVHAGSRRCRAARPRPARPGDKSPAPPGAAPAPPGARRPPPPPPPPPGAQQSGAAPPAGRSLPTCPAPRTPDGPRRRAASGGGSGPGPGGGRGGGVVGGRAGRRASLGTNFLGRPAPRPSARPPRRVGRPSRSRGPRRPEGGRGEPQGPAGPRKLPAAPPRPLAARPPPLPLHLLGRGLHPPGRPRPRLRGLARRGTGRRWLELLLLAPRGRGSPGRRRRGRRLLHLPGALTPRFQRADPSGTFATLLAFHGRHVTPPPASLSAAYQPGRGACGPGCSAAGPPRPAPPRRRFLPPGRGRPSPPPPARGLPAGARGPFCRSVTRPRLQYCPFVCAGMKVGNSVLKAAVRHLRAALVEKVS
ncbi:basic proline-rich protein-like [Prionailurus bengalensis]|uniref:basic proline-rich protein-like n=1 Tax=Prionailurus bengalensis TaxID=37029 RepID=UPI001CA98549|nr:basic proline-rich protein-like [Prionailurus bengalensis]